VVAGFRNPLIRLLIVAGLTPLMLAGCASLSGSPQRILGVTQDRVLLERYSVTKAIVAFSAANDNAREGLRPQQYRDMVVTVYLAAIDSRYDDYRSSISHERRELGLGFDATVMALTSAASVARSSLVSSLSATAATMAGTRAAIDRNVYFDQSLPGLLAAMDAQRFRARAQIMRNLQRNAVDYPLATAFADLSLYESSASIDQAIVEITSQAAADRRSARTELAAATQACAPEEGADEVAERLVKFVDLYKPNLVTQAVTPENYRMLILIAIGMDVPSQGSAVTVYNAILERISNGVNGRCAKSDLEGWIASVVQSTGQPIP
jgi:hypothetical protein